MDPLELSIDRFCNAYLTWMRERLAATTEPTDEAAAEAQQQWDDFREWLARPPADEALFRELTSDTRMRLPREAFSTTEATAARAYMEARAADRG